MLKSLTARTRQPYSGWPIGHPNYVPPPVMDEIVIDGASPYVIKNIDGLGPVKGEVSMMGSKTEADRAFLAYAEGQRNIVITLGFRPRYHLDDSVTSLRLYLMDVFSNGQRVELIFDTANRGPMEISGYIEDCDPTYWQKEPAVQISILCDKSYFDGPDTQQTFEVPSHEFNLNLDISVPIGFVFEMTMKEDAFLGNNARISNDSTGETVWVDYPLKKNDTVIINTIKNRRGVTLVRDQASTPLLGYVKGSLTKLKLVRGINKMRADLFNQSVPGSVKISYEKKYRGL